jgi:hypothetical protein
MKWPIKWEPIEDGPEQYARRKLRLKKDEPLVYRGLQLRCIGSKLWRERQQSISGETR